MARILFVDDDEILRELMRMYLESENFEVEEAENGQDAMEKLAGDHFDLIIVDVVMPVMDGIRFLAWLRNHEEPRPKIIVLSATQTVDEDKEFSALGVLTVIRKPVDPDEFLTEVQRHISA